MQHIRFGNIQRELPAFFATNSYSSVHLLVDENTHRNCYPLIQNALPPHQLIQTSSGEENKNIESCISIWNHLLEQSADRSSILLILGGGMLCDMGAFCASVYKRGIDFMLIPTSLLAQVDAAVGGKTAIDLNDAKNILGTFTDSTATFIDIEFLKTLSERQLRNGKAEMLKHGLISDFSHFKEVIGKDANSIPELDLVKQSISIKQSIVSNDFHEGSVRKKLNFGHSIGHALESCFLHRKDSLLHGEAIAAGMICETKLSAQKNLLAEKDAADIIRHILQMFPKVDLQNMDRNLFLNYLFSDKKNKQGQLLFVLLNDPGSALYDIPISSEEVLMTLEFYTQLNSNEKSDRSKKLEA